MDSLYRGGRHCDLAGDLDVAVIGNQRTVAACNLKRELLPLQDVSMLLSGRIVAGEERIVFRQVW